MKHYRAPCQQLMSSAEWPDLRCMSRDFLMPIMWADGNTRGDVPKQHGLSFMTVFEVRKTADYSYIYAA